MVIEMKSVIYTRTMKKQRFVYRTNLCFFNEVALFEG